MFPPLERLTSPLRHWKFSGAVPLPETEKLAEPPEHTVWLPGWPLTVAPVQVVPIVRMPAADVGVGPWGFVTVIVRARRAAAPLTVRFSVMCVGSVNVMVLTVTPPPLTVAAT